MEKDKRETSKVTILVFAKTKIKLQLCGHLQFLRKERDRYIGRKIHKRTERKIRKKEKVCEVNDLEINSKERKRRDKIEERKRERDRRESVCGREER